MFILMRPPLLSRSSTKPRGSEIRACSHSDLGEFLFWWRNCYWGEKIEKILIKFLEFPSVKFRKKLAEKLFLISLPCFQFIKKICKTRFSLSQKKHKNANNEKTTLTTPTFLDFKRFFSLAYTRCEHNRKFHRRKLKKIEINAKQTSKYGDV